MLTPDELKQKIEQTTLSEAMTLFKENVLREQLTHYHLNPVYQQEIKEDYERIDYDGSLLNLI